MKQNIAPIVLATNICDLATDECVMITAVNKSAILIAPTTHQRHGKVLGNGNWKIRDDKMS
jgi:hypothetical protein